MLLPRGMVCYLFFSSENGSKLMMIMMMMIGDAAVVLMKAGAEMDRKDNDGLLPLEVAPGIDVSLVVVRGLMWYV